MNENNRPYFPNEFSDYQPSNEEIAELTQETERYLDDMYLAREREEDEISAMDVW